MARTNTDMLENALSRRPRLVIDRDAAPEPAPDAILPPRPPGDLRHAAWAALHEVTPHLRGQDRDRARVLAARRTPEAAGAIDLLRTRMLQALRAHGWSRVAITSPTRNCGKTFLTATLAISFSRMPECRTLVLDLDLHLPSLARALGLEGAAQPIAPFLSGGQDDDGMLCRVGSNLALALNDAAVADSAELLQRAGAAAAIDAVTGRLAPDVVLYDMPPMLMTDDVIGFLPAVDAVLLVADGTRTSARDIAECERLLDGQKPLLGVVLNRADMTLEASRYGYGKD